MRKRWIIGIVIVLVAVIGIVGAVIGNDLHSLRRDVSDIDFKLGDLENALRGSPSRSTLDTVHRRVDIIRDDLRFLSIHHQVATMFFRGETRSVWDRFGNVEQRWKAADRQ